MAPPQPFAVAVGDPEWDRPEVWLDAEDGPGFFSFGMFAI